MNTDQIQSSPVDDRPFAHPMGWPQAIVGGLIYGVVVSGLVYLVWSTVTLAPVGLAGYLVCGWLFGVCFTVPLLDESLERSRIKKGEARDIREALRDR